MKIFKILILFFYFSIDVLKAQTCSIVVLKDTLVCDTPFVMAPLNPGSFSSSATYLWSTGETTPTISAINGGKYWVKVTDGSCISADTNKFSVWGQGNKGDYNWLFGDKAGLDFNNDPATAIATNSFVTNEGSSSISDPTGHLLFYTNGLNVYNKNNVIMDGGTGLLGDSNSTQSALIVPDPRVNNIYYVFTVDTVNGLNYSVVDLSYNNGLGKVTQVNISLPLSSPASEKLSGVKDDNGDFWVVSHGLHDDQFTAYKIGQSGLIATPTVSNVGSVYSNGEGYLKFSQDGTKAVVANKGENYVEVFDFDKTTGAFTNPIKITNMVSPYGVEFSSDNSKLYVSTNGDGHLYQYDITSSSIPVVEATRTLINIDSTTTEYGAIQMGPDGRIYIAIKGSSGTGFLDVINNPDLDSANLGYQHKIIDLSAGTSNSGLPNMVANYFTSTGWNIGSADVCIGTTTPFQGSAPDSVETWTWDFGDLTPLVSIPASGSKTTDSRTHKYVSPGIYHVRLMIHYVCGDTTFETDVTVYEMPVVNIKDTTACMVSSYTLDAGNPNASAWIWSNTTVSSPTNTVNASGNYSVTVHNGACSVTDNALITIVPPYNVNLGPDDIICVGDSLNASNAGTGGATFNWYDRTQLLPISNSPSINVSITGKYWVDVTKSTCKATDTIQLTVITPPVVNLGVDDSLCLGDVKQLDAGNPTFNYLWSTGEATDKININTTNKYWVDVYQGSCLRSDTINFKFNPGPSVSLAPQIIFCSENSPIKLYGGVANTYLWSPGGQTTDSITVTAEGIYTLDAKTAQGCSTVVSTQVLDICEAKLYVPTVFSPNADGSNDLFIIHGANISKYELMIFDQWGELIFVSNDMSNSWDGSYKGKVVPEGAYIWKINYEGETIKGLTKATKTGDVTVLR